MDKIEVTQADRVAAEPFFHWMIDEERVALMQAFARHRLATRTDATPVATDVAALVEAATVERVASAIGTSLAWDVEVDVRAGELTREEQCEVARKAIAAMKGPKL